MRGPENVYHTSCLSFCSFSFGSKHSTPNGLFRILFPLASLKSGQQETPVDAILAEDPHDDADLVKAKKQLLKRELIRVACPNLINDAELVAAERRYYRIKSAQFDIPGPDGNPARGELRFILRQMNRMEQRLQRQMNRMEQRMNRMEQRLQRQMNRMDQRLSQESQRAMNRSIRTNTEALVAVVRLEDGRVPGGFPATMEDFNRATGRQLNALLGFYNLVQPRRIAEKRTILRQHLGLNL